MNKARKMRKSKRSNNKDEVEFKFFSNGLWMIDE